MTDTLTVFVSTRMDNLDYSCVELITILRYRGRRDASLSNNGPLEVYIDDSGLESDQVVCDQKMYTGTRAVQIYQHLLMT